jgi:hypothetical protein
MITCGTRCEPDASGPSDQSTAAAPFALFSGDRRSFKKSVQSSDEMGMMIQLSIYCSCCRILRCVALRMQASEHSAAVAVPIRCIESSSCCCWEDSNPGPPPSGIFSFCVLEGGLGGLGQSFPLLKLYFGSSIFKIKNWIFLHTKSFRASGFKHPNQGFLFSYFSPKFVI